MELFVDWTAVVLLVALGVMIKYFKMHWLIAGYNTSPVKERQAMSEQGIGEYMGNALFILAGILALGNLGKYLGYTAAQTASWILFLVVLGYIVFRARKFAPDRQVPEKSRRQTTILVLGIGLMLSAFIIGGNQKTTVEIQDHQIEIGGLYSTAIDLDRVRDIRLEDAIPSIQSRTNGYAFGDARKGDFILEDLGAGKLYLEAKEGPYVFIMTEGSYAIVNFDSPEKTGKLYNQLREVWNKESD